MATDNLNTLNFTFVRRAAPKSGPSSADAWNDSFSELANDLAAITFEWNNKLVPVFDGLPAGILDTAVNVYSNGLDGKNIWVDQSVVSTDDDLTYFNAVKDRPSTLHESFQNLYIYIADQLEQLSDELAADSTGITTDQKNSIGANIFDNTQTSTALSLDGKSENNRLNIIQIAADFYGTSYSLDNDGATNLTNSLFQMVDALLELHNGNWDDDIALDHTGAFTATQAEINSSAPGNDTFVGVPTHLEEDLDQIRANIKTLKGTAGWQSAHTALYGGGADSLEELLASTVGSAAKSAGNPWGYSHTDVDGLTTRLDAIKTFTGQSTQTDAAPTYSSTVYVTDTDALEVAVGDLDAALNAAVLSLGSDISDVSADVATVSGELTPTFLDHSDTPANYTSDAYKVPRVNSGETALEFSDVTATPSGVLATTDFEVTASGIGFVLRSPDDTRWRVSIDDTGTLFTTAL